jgi:hypothetical protein
VAARLVRAGQHRHVVGDDGHLGFEIDAVVLARHGHVVHGAEQVVGAALVDERIGPEARRHGRVARLAHEFDVVDVGRPVDPVVRAWQRRHRLRRVEGDRTLGLVALEPTSDVLELRGDARPVVERGLQRRGERPGRHRTRQIATDDDEAAVARAVPERGELHGVPFQLST